MQTHVTAWTLYFVIIGYINVAVCEGPWCYVCDKAVAPGSCGEIIKCSDDEQCYASSTGVSPTQYTAGCRKKQVCQGTGSVAGGTSPHGCEECCFGDHCNSELCGGLPVPKGGNRLCLQCEAVLHPSQCTAVTKCGLDKYCSIWKRNRFQFTFYDLGCLEKSQCGGHMKGEHQLLHGGFVCCNDDLCNSHENNDHLTPAPTSPTATTSLPATAIRTGNIKCKMCPIVQQPSLCQSETECGPDQYCSVRKIFQLGLTFYDLGCQEKTECVGHMTTLGEDGIRCCNEDLCNANVNPVTGSATPSVTALATAESSTSTSSSPPTTTIRSGNLKCKNCGLVPQPSSCQEETLCGPDQYCSVRRIFQLGMTVYDLGCEEKTACVGHMTTLGEDGIRCCNEDLCNANVNPVTGSTAPSVTSPATAETSSSSTNSSSLPLMAPQIKKTNQTVDVILGTTVFLVCDVTGNPEPSVTWAYDKTASPNAHQRGSSLAISSVDEKNEGIYKCVANNTLGTAEAMVHLHVTEPVSVKGDPAILVLSQVMNFVKLKCVGEGIPPPAVTLSKYGEDISADSSYHRINPAEILIMGVTDANMLKYDGVYVCNATNGETSATASQIVAINVTTPIDGQVPFNNVSTTPLKAFQNGDALTKVSLDSTFRTQIFSINTKFWTVHPRSNAVALCPSGHTVPDGSPITHEFNLDDLICPSARLVGVIDTNPGAVTWLIRPDGKAQFLNGSANVDFGNVNFTAVMTTPSTPLSSSARTTPTQTSLLSLSSLQPSTMSNIQNVASWTTTLMAMTTSFVTQVPLNSVHTTQSGNITSSHSSAGQSLLSAASSREALNTMASNPPTPSIAMTSFSSSVTSSSEAGVGTYASPRGVSSSGMVSSSPLDSLALRPSSSLMSSSEASVGTYASLRDVSPSGMASSSPLHTLALRPSSSLISSSGASAGIYASSKGMSPSGMTSRSISLALTSPPSLMSSSEAGVGTYASARGVSSSGMASSSPLHTLALRPSSNLISSSEASAGIYASSKGMSPSGMTSRSISLALTSPPSLMASSEAGVGTYASPRGVSSSRMASSSPLDSLAVRPSPSLMSSSEASAGTYASSKGMSPSGMTSRSISLALTSPPSLMSSSEAGVGIYASARGVSSSGMTSRSISLALTSPPSLMSSSEAGVGTYASSTGVSSSGMASSSPLDSLALRPSPSLISSSEPGVGTYASRRGVSSSGVASSSALDTLALRTPPSLMSSSEVRAVGYASLSGMISSPSTPSLAKISLPSSVSSSSEASAGTHASLRAISSSFKELSSSAPSIEPSGTILASQLRKGVSSSSVALPSLSTTFPMSVQALGVSSAANLLSSQSAVNNRISSHPPTSLSGPNSYTPFLPTSSSRLMSLPVASSTQAFVSGLLSQIISPSSSALTTRQSSAIPGTYKQEPTTGGATATTTEPGVAPNILNPKQSINAFTGKDVILSCNVTGVPEPSVTWYYDKQRRVVILTQGATKRKVVNADPVGNNLRLDYVTKYNTGDYTCVAENSAGQANGTVHVQTHNPLKVTAKKPIVILEPDIVGNQLQCDTEGDPKPKVTWSKYGGLDLSTDQTVLDTGDGELFLSAVTKANLDQYEGIYICQADNGVSSDKAYVVAAANMSETLDSSKTFSDFNMKPGAAIHATCVPGTVDADGSPLSTTFGPGDSVCDSVRRVGVLAKDSGPVTWFIRLDGKAEFVSDTKGAVLSIADPVTTRDTPMSDQPRAATTVIAPLTCETCSGPGCGMVPGKDTLCSSMTPFCMNSIIVKVDQTRIFTKSCASAGDCETKWWQQTSDEDSCMKMPPVNPYGEDLTCSFCCTTPGCNKDMIPKKDTLYEGNA